MFKLPKMKCMRCGKESLVRVENPMVCPKCHSPGWNTPRKYKVKPKAVAEVKTEDGQESEKTE